MSRSYSNEANVRMSYTFYKSKMATLFCFMYTRLSINTESVFKLQLLILHVFRLEINKPLQSNSVHWCIEVWKLEYELTLKKNHI